MDEQDAKALSIPKVAEEDLPLPDDALDVWCSKVDRQPVVKGIRRVVQALHAVLKLVRMQQDGVVGDEDLEALK